MTPDLIAQVMNDLVPFHRFLGLRVEEVRAGYTRVVMPFRPEFIGDPTREALHGGIAATLADTAGGIAVWTAVQAAESRVSTIDLRVDYLSRGKPEDLVAVSTLIRVGSKHGVADVRLFHDSNPDELVASARGVYNVFIKAR